MNCCCPHSISASRWFSFFAGRHRKRFEAKGFEPSQEHLMAGLTLAGFKERRILEIGCGVGHLHQTMLEQGASTATGVDLAPKMIEEAHQWAQQRGLSDRATYIEGDFMDMQDSFEPADIMILDKVVCCYPDADGLVHGSLAKTRHVYALTYPRDRWYTRLMMGFAAVMMKVLGSDFRPYVHDPKQIEAWIKAAGFEKSHTDETTIWLTQVYSKG